MTWKQAEYMSMYAKGLTVTEIARYCGKSKSTISTVLKAARQPEKQRGSRPCPYNPDCFTCPMRDCVMKEGEAIRAAVKAVMGDTGEIRVGEYGVTWGAIKSARIDTTALKKSTPDISEAFTRETTTRRFCVA